MNILRQLQRGIKSAWFWCGFVLTLFTLQFVHMDAGLYWSDPLAYFGSGDFYYTFIISIYVGILRFMFPLCALLPAGMLYAEDKESRFLISTLHRQRPRRYVVDRMASAVLISTLMVAMAVALTTVFYLLVCPVEFQEDSFQVAAMSSAYGWRARPEYFYVFILEATGRLILSAAFWSLLALAFSGIWPNKVFILVATLVFGYALEAFQLQAGATEWTISFIQAPDVDTQTALWIPLLKQLACLGGAAALCYASLRCAVSARVQRMNQRIRDHLANFANRVAPPQHLMMPHRLAGTRAGRIWVDFRAFCSPMVILCTLVVTTLCVLLSDTFSYAKYSLGDLLLGTFGGIAWVDPELDFYAIGKWVLLLLPPMMGVAYSLERELASRKLITVYRYGDPQEWWRSKAVSSLLSSFFTVCLMFVWTLCIGWLAGARGFTVYITDADGFAVPGNGTLAILFAQFALQVMMLTQLQVLFHAAFRDMKAGVVAYLVPLLGQLVACSNVENISNIWMPANWGMISRTSVYCVSGYTMSDGEWMDLCAIEPYKAIIAQVLAIMLLYTLHRIIVPAVNREKN
jgi:hypothetical protein